MSARACVCVSVRMCVNERVCVLWKLGETVGAKKERKFIEDKPGLALCFLLVLIGAIVSGYLPRPSCLRLRAPAIRQSRSFLVNISFSVGFYS